jgi:hypothetical protein
MKYGSVLLFVGVLALPLPAQSEQVKRPHLLQAIIFESYITQPPENLRFYDVVELPSNDFPLKFSRLFDPSGSSETIQLPRNMAFPRAPMFLDAYTFDVTEEQIPKKNFSHRNDIQHIDYKVRFLSWSKDRYKAELEGRVEELKFKHILIEAAVDKTTIVRIRRSANRTVYIALTAIEASDSTATNIIPPKPVSRPLPVYPSDLLKINWAGRLRIFTVITREGKADGKKVILLDCPHFLLGRNGLDAVLNQWTFKPATRDGIPLDFETIIEVDFYLPKPRGRDMPSSGDR